MKLKNILFTIAAVAALVSCEKEQPVKSLPGLEISESYIYFAKEGGLKTLSIKADVDWTIDTTGTSKWLTVAPIKGEANAETSVSLTATANNAGEKKAEITLKLANDKTKCITLFQAGNPPAPATVDDVIKGTDGTTYEVSGTVKSIVNVHYGNIYINDGTSETDLYLYGVLDKKGNAMSSSTAYDVLNPATSANAWDISVGDVITVVGARKTYSGTIEFENAEILKVVKSLVDVTPVELSAAKEGGIAEVVVKYKGTGLKVVPKVDWISLDNVDIQADSTIVKLNIAANEGGPRKGTVEISSSIPGQSSVKEVSVTQEGSTTPINELTVNAPCFVSGTVTALCAAGFIITDDTGSILYYAAGFTNPNGYAVGDKVEVTCSKVTAYNGALEVEPANITKEVKVGHEDYTYPAPTLMGRAAVEEYLASCDGVNTPAEYVKTCGTISISGNYYNILYGESEKQGSLYQATAEQKALFENGKTYEITAYLIGYSKKNGVVTYANFLVLGAKEVNPTKTFAEIYSAKDEIAASEKPYSCEATVMAVGSNQVALSDGTGLMFMYNKAKNATVGTKIFLNGNVTVYNGCLEWNDPAFYVSQKNVPVEHPTPATLDAAEYAALQSNPAVKYYSVSGTKAASGYDFNCNGFTVNPYSNISIAAGSTTTLYGYSIGIKSNKLNFIVASVGE